MQEWTLSKIKQELERISKMGWIPTMGSSNMGVGKTLENLLGIKDNNLRLPDLGEIELKSTRVGSDSMLTIATKSPLPKGINRILFEKYKYLDDHGYHNLHSTVYGSRKNQQSFQVVFTGDRLVLENEYAIEAYWPIGVFGDVVKFKSNKILLVFAETRGERNSDKEEFHYTAAYLLSGLNMDKFKLAVESDKLKIDIRIGSYRTGKNKGKYHDHGTAFRIHQKDFLYLFDSYEKII